MTRVAAIETGILNLNGQNQFFTRLSASLRTCAMIFCSNQGGRAASGSPRTSAAALRKSASSRKQASQCARCSSTNRFSASDKTPSS